MTSERKPEWLFESETRIFIPINWTRQRRDDFWRYVYHFILPPLIAFNPDDPKRDSVFPSKEFVGAEHEFDPIEGTLTVESLVIASGNRKEDRKLLDALYRDGQIRVVREIGDLTVWETKAVTYKDNGFYELNIVFSKLDTDSV